MILQSIALHNIRSYEDEVVPISPGITLFEGDIACGKSTLLYSIEFALFGLGALKGSYLLRNGAREGSIKLCFEADGVDYEVFRKLVRRNESVHQTDCYLKYNGSKASLTSAELKEKILQILKFNEPANARSQSVI